VIEGISHHHPKLTTLKKSIMLKAIAQVIFISLAVSLSSTFLSVGARPGA
jgi:hypothetical protein